MCSRRPRPSTSTTTSPTTTRPRTPRSAATTTPHPSPPRCSTCRTARCSTRISAATSTSTSRPPCRSPTTCPGGPYQLVVVANGIASDPFPFTQVNGATWTSLGSGLAGVFGIPLLDGHGTQIAGQPAEIDLILANPFSPAVLFVGLS